MLMRLYRLLRGTLPLAAVFLALAGSTANADFVFRLIRVINSLDRPVAVSYDGKQVCKQTAMSKSEYEVEWSPFVREKLITDYDGKVEVKEFGVGERFFIELRVGTPPPP